MNYGMDTLDTDAAHRTILVRGHDHDALLSVGAVGFDIGSPAT
jgi:hypothetical protein